MKRIVLRLIDVLFPVVFLSALVLKFVRRAGVERMPMSKRILLVTGVFPVRDHYYEPLFNPKYLRVKDYSEPRVLSAINWNLEGQLRFLKGLETYAEEGVVPAGSSFGAGDAEYWYALIRYLKPKQIIEIGSGTSTQIAIQAIERSRVSDPLYECAHTCIEPYEAPWLERARVTLIRKRVEELDLKFFRTLKRNDVLFIDSSHIIRPQGDVVTEVLQILPLLEPGVVVHFHDIFTPRDYPYQWVVNEVRLWNEQYLLEAFLSHNCQWEIIGALNYLHHEYPEAMKRVCSSLNPAAQPGSFYIRKRAHDGPTDKAPTYLGLALN
jgi:hypothetical protein